MSYKNTFVKVSEDCPVKQSEIPLLQKNKKTRHLIQYELLMENPYRFNHEELIYEVHIRYAAFPPEELLWRSEVIREELFSKSHPCMRASALVKRYGFGVHYDREGKMAVYPMESPLYHSFLNDASLKVVNGMRNKKLKSL